MISVFLLIPIFFCLTISMGFLVIAYDLMVKITKDPDGFLVVGAAIVPLSVTMATFFASLCFLCVMKMIAV